MENIIYLVVNTYSLTPFLPEACFNSKELAQKYIDKFPYKLFTIVSIQLNLYESFANSNSSIFYVELNKQKFIKRIEQINTMPRNFNKYSFKTYHKVNYCQCYIFADNIESAKIKAKNFIKELIDKQKYIDFKNIIF